MTLHDQTEKAKSDWNKLAKDALDLWQNHLTSLANDPQAKEEMAQLVGPMGKMFSDWTDMVQNSMAGMMPCTTSRTFRAAQTEPASKAQASPAAQTQQAKEETVKADDVGSVSAEPVVCETKEEDDQGVEDQTYESQPSQSTSAPVSEEPSLPSSGSKANSSSTGQGGSAVSSDGHRNMVELADRLAFLERELEELRVKREQEKGGKASDNFGEDSLDSVNQPRQQVAGADQR
jgi:hypothetical protein